MRMKLFDYLKRSDVDVILSELQIRELHEKLKKHLLSLLEGVLPRLVRDTQTSEKMVDLRSLAIGTDTRTGTQRGFWCVFELPYPW